MEELERRIETCSNRADEIAIILHRARLLHEGWKEKGDAPAALFQHGVLATCAFDDPGDLLCHVSPRKRHDKFPPSDVLSYAEFLERLGHPESVDIVTAIARFVASAQAPGPTGNKFLPQRCAHFFAAMMDALWRHPAFGNAGRRGGLGPDAAANAASSLERLVMGRIHDVAAVCAAEPARDAALARRLRLLRFLRPSDLDPALQTVMAAPGARDAVAAARAELHAVAGRRSPGEKAACIVRCCRGLVGLLVAVQKLWARQVEAAEQAREAAAAAEEEAARVVAVIPAAAIFLKDNGAATEKAAAAAAEGAAAGEQSGGATNLRLIRSSSESSGTPCSGSDAGTDERGSDGACGLLPPGPSLGRTSTPPPPGRQRQQQLLQQQRAAPPPPPQRQQAASPRSRMPPPRSPAVRRSPAQRQSPPRQQQSPQRQKSPWQPQQQSPQQQQRAGRASGTGGVGPTADDLLPLLIYTLLTAGAAGRAASLRLPSSLRYVEEYHDADALHGRSGYCLASLQAAVEFVLTLDGRSLCLSPAEFDRRVAEAERLIEVEDSLGFSGGGGR